VSRVVGFLDHWLHRTQQALIRVQHPIRTRSRMRFQCATDATLTSPRDCP